MTGVEAPVIAVAAGTAGALAAAAADRRAAYGVAKAVASGGFVWLAAWSALASRAVPAALVLAGLAVAALSDVVLAAPGRGALLAGLGGFALAHLLSTAGFLLRAGGPWALGAALAGAVAAWAVRRWLAARLGGRVLDAVTAYAAVAGALAAAGVGAAWATGAWQLGLGAILVVASDLAVAAERFFGRGWAAKAVGLPVYYAGQVLVALGIAAL